MTSIGSILLLSNDQSLYDEISRLLNMYKIISQRFSLTELLVYMHKNNTIAIIIDLDEYGYSACRAIALSDTDNYIPVLALSSKGRNELQLSDTCMEYFMSKADIHGNLYNIIKIFTDFKKKYIDIRQCYDINDLINSETDCLLKKFTVNGTQYFN